MTKDKLWKICTAILKGESITKEKIIKYGITQDELDQLLNKRIIKKISQTEYKVIDFNTLYDCGNAIINNREYNEGILYLEECYKMNKEHTDTKLRLLLAYIGGRQYKKTYEILDSLKGNGINEKDYNLILYLLSIITICPDKYTSIVLSIEQSDIEITSSDDGYSKISSHNAMRKYILNDRFYNAGQMYQKELIHAFPNRTVSEIVQKLTSEALEVSKRRKLIIINLLQNKQYRNIIDYAKKKKSNTKLNKVEKIIYTVSKDILWIKENNKIPRPTVKETTSLEEAIKGKNYYLALKIITENHTEIHDNHLRKEVTSLLVDINKLIRQVYDDYKQKQELANNVGAKTKKRIP